MTRYRRLRNRLGSVGLALCMASRAWLALDAQADQPSYSPLDFPGAAATNPLGINSAGDIVGTYRDVSGRTHGFVRRNGMFTSIDFPGAVFTAARGIGPSGDVVGAYRLGGEPDANLHGFIVNQRGEFTRVDVPGHTSTVAVRLLPDGSIIGCYHDADQMNSMRGMRIAADAVTPFDRSSTMHTGATAGPGTIVGFFTDASAGRGRGYVLEGSTFTPFDVPDSRSTSAQDISASGLVVGVYQDTSGRFHGFARQEGRYTTIDVPNATDTRAMGVNREGTIVGSFVDAAGTTHGFVRTRATQ